jgi:hypothetical protein
MEISLKQVDQSMHLATGCVTKAFLRLDGLLCLRLDLECLLPLPHLVEVTRDVRAPLRTRLQLLSQAFLRVRTHFLASLAHLLGDRFDLGKARGCHDLGDRLLALLHCIGYAIAAT